MWYEFLINHSLIPRKILIKSIQYMLKRNLSKFSDKKKLTKPETEKKKSTSLLSKIKNLAQKTKK